MFARVTRIHVKSDMIDEAIKIYEESVTPARKAQKGSRGAYLLTDRRSGKGLAITFWDSEADIIVTEQSGYLQEQLNKFKDVFASPAIREIYEVSFQD